MDQADGVAAQRAVRATFASADQMQAAVTQLSMSGFDRADLSLPSPELIEGTQTPEAGSKAADTEEDSRQARTLGASTAATVAAMAAVGVTVATGGAAAPAIAAAVIAGGAAGGSVFAIHGATDRMEQKDRDTAAANGELVLAVRAATDARQSEAETILRAAGATQIEIVA